MTIKKIELLSQKEENNLNKLFKNLPLGEILRRIADATGELDFVKTPLADMSDVGYENMSDMEGYILSELKSFAAKASIKIESAIQPIDLSPIIKKVEDIEELKRSIRLLSVFIEKKIDRDEILSAINFLANEVDRSKTYVRDITVSSAELLTLNTSPISLIPAPGAGKYIEIKRVELFLDYETTTYSNINPLSVSYGASVELQQIPTSGLLDTTNDERQCVHHSSNHVIGENEGITLGMLIANPTSGDSPLKIRIDYKIIEVIV